MFNVVTLAICFLFLIAVWQFQVPGPAEDFSLASTNPKQKREEFR